MGFASKNFWEGRDPAPWVFYFSNQVQSPFCCSFHLGSPTYRASPLPYCPSQFHTSFGSTLFRLLLLHALSLSSPGWLCVHLLFHSISFTFPGSCPVFIWITHSLFSIPCEYGHWVHRKVKSPWCNLCHFPRRAWWEVSISRGTKIVWYF